MKNDIISGLLKTNLSEIKSKFTDPSGKILYTLFYQNNLKLSPLLIDNLNALRDFVKSKPSLSDSIYINISKTLEFSEETLNNNTSKNANNPNFETKLSNNSKLSTKEKIEKFDHLYNDFKDKIGKSNDKEEKIATSALASEETFLLTKVFLEKIDESSKSVSEKEKKDILKESKVKELAGQSKKIIELISSALIEKTNTSKTFSKLKDYQDGNTLGHIVRVFIHIIKFMNFINYNLKHSLMQKLPPLFSKNERYATYYGFPYSSFFMENFRQFTPNEINTASQGALFHDIGKLANIDYFESDQNYNRIKIELHAFRGFQLIHSSGEFAHTVSHIAGAHHEYNQHSSGYGIVRSIYSRYQTKDEKIPRYYFSNDSKNVANFSARNHFITCAISIIDIYDALQCGKRQYRDSAFSEPETIKLLTAMVFEEKKIDLFVYDLFIEYLKSEHNGSDNYSEFHNNSLFNKPADII